MTKFIQQLNIKTRLTVFYTLIFSIVFSLFAFYYFKTIEQITLKDFDNAIYNYALDIADSISQSRSGQFAIEEPLFDFEKIYPFSLGTALIQVRDIKGRIFYKEGEFGTFDPPFDEEYQLLKKGKEFIYRTVEIQKNIPEPESDYYRILTMPIDQAKLDVIIQVAAPMTFPLSQLEELKSQFELLFPIVMLIIAVISYLLAGQSLKPVQLMISTAQSLKSENLSERLPVPETKDEIQQLAKTLNQYLTRVEKAFRSQEKFIADASHQLLTPVTTLQSQIQVLLQKKEPASVQTLQSLFEDTQQLNKIIQQMLILSRIDAGKGALTFTEFHIEEIIFQAISKLNKTADQKQIKLKFDILDSNIPPKKVYCDPDFLEILFFNIIENAIKYSPTNETVCIQCLYLENKVQVQIIDHGPGISDTSLPLIFNRFSRGNRAEDHGKGYGLGLAIAQQISLLHRGKLSVFNNLEKGSTFQFEINYF